MTVADLQVEGAITALMKEAVKPNLVQTLEETPAIVHGGPFANIAHGCNSVIATKMALTLADYTVTEQVLGPTLVLRNSWILRCLFLERVRMQS